MKFDRITGTCSKYFSGPNLVFTRAELISREQEISKMPLIDYDGEAELFDYNSEAELFSMRRARTGNPTKPPRKPVGYRRFARAADAIRFAVEDLSPDLLSGAYLDVGDDRFDGIGIRRLYESPHYPLARATRSA
jgi:hypothetical protein